MASRADSPADAAVLPADEAASLPIVPVRHWGRWVAAVILLAAVVAIVVGLSHARIRFGDVPKFFTTSAMISGLWHTLLLAVVCEAIGILLGTVVAIMRTSKNPVASSTAWIYVFFFRGTPVLLQLLIWYNLALAFKTVGIPGLFSMSTNQLMTPFVAAMLGLGLNESAYMSEIVRAGFNSIDHGQVEAAHAIGMTPGRTLRRVILPQAMRVIIPPTGNDFINMLKETSLASVISYVELTQAASNIYSHNLEVIEALLAAAIWYLILVSVASVGQHYIERAFSPDARAGRDRVGPGILRSLQLSFNRGSGAR